MRRFLSSLMFCLLLLAALSYILFPRAYAKEDPVAVLLGLPAPPPPNPLSANRFTYLSNRADNLEPPADDAPIEELVAYWSQFEYRTPINRFRRTLEPSPKVVGRLLEQTKHDAPLLPRILNILPQGGQTAEFVKTRYDELLAANENPPLQRRLKDWLRLNSSYFSAELDKKVSRIKDSNGYVDLQSENNLLALTQNDFDTAEPTIRRLYADTSNPVSQALATWALYKHALDSESSSDIERYRTELMRMVENRALSDGVRDKANDGLTHEKHFPGLEEWTFSLFEDETLLRSRYTMLTTFAMFSDDKELGDKFLKLIKSSSKPQVRAAAIRNLLLVVGRDDDPQFKGAAALTLLPWLEDRNWAEDVADSRSGLVQILREIQLPESVPALIKLLDEQDPNWKKPGAKTAANSATAANSVASPAIRAANAAVRAANASANVAGVPDESDEEYIERYPLRDAAISALAMQQDPRAVPHLKRILNDVEGYKQSQVIVALLACKGFSIPEQVESLELVAKNIRELMDNPPSANAANAIANAATSSRYAAQKHVLTPAEIKLLVGHTLAGSKDVTDPLAHAVVDRIGELDNSNKRLAEAFREMTLRWQSSVIDLLHLSDLKRGQADAAVILKLLAGRKHLREKQFSDVTSLRSGTATAWGISTCLLEDRSDAALLVASGPPEVQRALLACSRLIRLPLPVDKVANLFASSNLSLMAAAERYLESEDSPEARSIILARYPGEGRILGATTAFFVANGGETSSLHLRELFQDINSDSYLSIDDRADASLKKVETDLQNEIKTSPDLIAVYAYGAHFVRIYKNEVRYRFVEDASRYRERPLTRSEYNQLASYIRENKVDDLPPFLTCTGEYCGSREFLMVGKNGGRRVFVRGEAQGPIVGLENIFEEFAGTAGRLHYVLSAEIPGLEIVIASDELHAETVWKDGADLKLVGRLTVVRTKVESEINTMIGGDDDDDADTLRDLYEQQQTVREKRAYEGFGWYFVTANGAESGASQPPGVEFIPRRDSLDPPIGVEQWKARGADFEIRASGDGLYKISRGRPTRIASGSYSSSVVTANGRWVVASKHDEENGILLVRVNLATNKETQVALPDETFADATVFIPGLNKVLLTERSGYYDHGDRDGEDEAPRDAGPDAFLLLDPATGAVQPVAGEFRPLDQQTFRPLQSTGKPDEYWAAMPDREKERTVVGIYETRTFGFTPLMTVPKIRFNSMSMWVDEPGKKVYFVYRGHLLALPLKR